MKCYLTTCDNIYNISTTPNRLRYQAHRPYVVDDVDRSPTLHVRARAHARTHARLDWKSSTTSTTCAVSARDYKCKSVVDGFGLSTPICTPSTTQGA